MPVAGWDFSWFAGRATEQRPSWGYARLLGRQMAIARRAVDVQTGGGEVLAEVPTPPPLLVATEAAVVGGAEPGAGDTRVRGDHGDAGTVLTSSPP